MREELDRLVETADLINEATFVPDDVSWSEEYYLALLLHIRQLAAGLKCELLDLQLLADDGPGEAQALAPRPEAA